MRFGAFLYALILACFVILANIKIAAAHVSEQGIVLLLPTNIYIISGCLAVISSMVLVAFLPHDRVFGFFRSIRLPLPSFDFFFQNKMFKVKCIMYR